MRVCHGWKEWFFLFFSGARLDIFNPQTFQHWRGVTVDTEPRRLRRESLKNKKTTTSTREGHLEDIEKTDLDAKIECGHCGEVYFFAEKLENVEDRCRTYSSDSHRDQVKSDAKECQMQSLTEHSWRPIDGATACFHSKT